MSSERIHTMCACKASRRRAFSLIEAAVVVAMVGILAASAVPAVRMMSETGEAAAAAEIERTFVIARATAMATGTPTGVQVSAKRGLVQLLRVAGDGRGTEPLYDALGFARQPVDVSVMYGSIEIGQLATEGGRGTINTLWFNHHGVPEERDRSGANVERLERDAIMTIGKAAQLRVRALTGLTELTP